METQTEALRGQLPTEHEKLTCVGEGSCGETKDVRKFVRYKDKSYSLLCFKCGMRVGKERWEAGPGKDVPIYGRNVSINAGIIRSKEKGDKTRQLYVDLIRAGRTQAEALQEVKRTVATYQGWRRRYPEFSAAVDAARSKRFREGKNAAKENHAGFAPFRAKYFNHESYEHQQRLVHALESTKPQEITLCLMYPEAGKTTTIVDYICYVLARDPNHRFAYISEGGELANDVVAQIKKRLNPEDGPTPYTIDFGPFYEKGQERRGKPWAEDRFSVLGCNHDEKEPTMAAAGWGKKVYGKRWDTLIVDDVQGPESIAATEKMLKYIRLTLLSRVGRFGKVVIIGTHIGIGDLYWRMIEEKLPHNVILVQALKADGTSTCPEMWPDEALAEKRRQVGEELWATAYMQRPSSDQMVVFNASSVNACKDHDRRIGPLPWTHFNALGLDPALVGGNALTAAALTSEKLYLLDTDKRYNLAKQENILLGIQSFAGLYRPKVLIVEQNAYQKALANDERLRKLADTYKFKVIPHTTSKNKSDSFFGVSAMAQSVDMGEIRLPWGDVAAHHKLRSLLKEFEDWRPNVPPKLLEQDQIMSLWFIWNYWMSVRLTFNPRPMKEPRPNWMTDSNWRAKQMQQQAQQRRRRSYVA